MIQPPEPESAPPCAFLTEKAKVRRIYILLFSPVVIITVLSIVLEVIK